MQKSENLPVEPPKTDVAKEVELDIKVTGTPSEPNEGGDSFLPHGQPGGSSSDGVIDDNANFPHDHHDGCGCPSGKQGVAGETGSGSGSSSGSSGSSGPSGISNSKREARRLRHQRRHNGRVIAVPGLSVICPIGSQLRAEKRIGPNDLCPCKSGKKFKKCCLNKE